MTENNASREKIERGRRLVEDYRAAYARLHAAGSYPAIHDDHTPLLAALIKELLTAGFDSVAGFFDQSDQLSRMEAGITNFTEPATPEAIREIEIRLKEMWH